MHSIRTIPLIALLLVFGTAQAQTGKIVCWKDKAGKTSCGDKVPPEYQDNSVKELNRQGVTVKQSETALTPEQKKAQQAEVDRKKMEKQAATEQSRRDKALLDTFSSAKEIDLKRTRDIQLIESNIEAQQANLKNANDRQADARKRIDQVKKQNKPVPPTLQEEYDIAEASQAKIQAQIAQKRKEIADKHLEYDEMKKRFAELTGTTSAPAPAAPAATPVSAPATPGTKPAPAPAPTASTAPAKK
jgi:DNA repair exonuclease SbcCD ATPase subunit